MKPLLHLVRTDLRRLSGWLLLLAAVCVAMDVLGFVVLASQPAVLTAPLSSWVEYRAMRDALLGVEAMVAFALVVVLVQADRVAGTRAFWMTRPISGATLLLAKGITAVLVLVVLPSLISLPWWVWCGFGAHEIGLGVGAFATEAAAIAVPTAFVASLMDSVSRAWLWGLIVVPLAAVLFLFALFHGNVGGLPPDAAQLAAMAPIRLPMMEVVFVFVTFAAVTAAQYVSRAGRVAGTVFGSGVLLCLAAWHVNFGWFTPFATHDAADAAAVQVRYLNSDAQRVSPNEVRVWTRFGISGVPRGLLLVGTGIGETWQEPARGRRLGVFSRLDSEFVQSFPATLDFHGKPLFVPTLVVARSDLRASQASVLTAHAVRLDAQLGFLLLRPRIVAERPLADTGWHAQGGRGLRLLGVQRLGPKIECAAITTAVDPSLDPHAWAPVPEQQLVCAVIDGDSHTLVPLSDTHQFGSLSINSVLISCRTMRAMLAPAGAHVTVAPIAVTEQARITRRVQVDNFRLKVR